MALICAMGSCLVAAIVVSVVFLSREPMPNAAPVAGDSSVDPDGELHATQSTDR